VNAPLQRPLRPAGPVGRRQLQSLLSGLWAAEVLRPSRLLILALPALSEIAALDNRTGTFSPLEPSWGERIVRLTDILMRNLAWGGEVCIVTHLAPEGPNRLLARLRERADGEGLGAGLRTGECEALPRTGIFGDDFALIGPLHLVDPWPEIAEPGLIYELNPGQPHSRADFAGVLS